MKRIRNRWKKAFACVGGCGKTWPGGEMSKVENVCWRCLDKLTPAGERDDSGTLRSSLSGMGRYSTIGKR